jgi:hypothetical protein
LDCVAVKLHNMKAIPSTGERPGNGQQLLLRGPRAGGMLCAMTLIVALES